MNFYRDFMINKRAEFTFSWGWLLLLILALLATALFLVFLIGSQKSLSAVFGIL